MGVIGTSELGTPERVAQLEKMKQRKTDHGETVVTCFRSRYYKCWLSKTLAFSLLPTFSLAVTNTFLLNHAMSVQAKIISCQVSMDMEI